MTIGVSYVNVDKGPAKPDEYIVVYLHYMSGCWTVVRHESTLDSKKPGALQEVFELCFAIDKKSYELVGAGSKSRG